MSASVANADPSVSATRIEGLGDNEFTRIADSIKTEAGICLPESKRTLVHSRVSKRLRATGMTSFREYCDFLDTPQGKAERLELLSALTTNVTRFFREPHHFEILKTVTLPPLVEKARKGGRVRIWSAGCSSGEEPYSIALTLLSLLPDAGKLDVKILATDIDKHILHQGRQGIYDAEDIEMIPADMRRNAFSAAPDGDVSKYEVGAPVKQLVAFKPLNLISPAWPVKGPFDIIFCRNTTIYFDAPTQHGVWNGFERVLAPGGYLFIGHSERVNGPAAARFSTAGLTTYRKNS